MKKFHIGQNSLEVCKVIVKNNIEISDVKLIFHRVGINWRETYKSTYLKYKNLEVGLKHDKPIRTLLFKRKQFLGLELKDLAEKRGNGVWSIISKINCKDGSVRHIPMMNFHPESGSVRAIKKALKLITRNKKGCLLHSGRFYHYFGNYLLRENEWIKFVANFLMPCTIVSPRYIGHRIYDGYCTLRLTRDEKFKPKLPEVIEVL